MPVPDSQTLMLPVLELSTVGPISAEAIIPEIARRFRLSQEDVEEKLGNGIRKIVNCINWAQVNLERAGLVEKLRPGTFQATSEGKRVLAEHPERIDTMFLKRFPRYRESLRDAGRKAAETRAGRS